MLWSGALIRAYCHPDRQTLNLWWPTKFLQSGALTRAHSVPERTTHVLQSEALIGTHWLPDRSKTSFDQELLWEFIDYLIDRQTSCDQKLLIEPSDPPINHKLLAISLIRAHWLPHWPTNMLWSGALIRAHCHPNRHTLNLWLTNKRHEIGSSYQGSFCDRKLLSELTDSLIDQNCLRSGALMRARWLPDHPTNLLLLGALIRTYCLPDWSEFPCDQELVSELSDSRIDQQPSCDREL